MGGQDKSITPWMHLKTRLTGLNRKDSMIELELVHPAASADVEVSANVQTHVSLTLLEKKKKRETTVRSRFQYYMLFWICY